MWKMSVGAASAGATPVSVGRVRHDVAGEKTMNSG
jgi:hypothetical protein